MSRVFCPDDIKRSLVLVTPIVKDIVRKRKEMVTLRNMGFTTSHVQERSKQLAKEIIYHLDELEQIGCFLKDFETGQVDFPSESQGKTVFLSWHVPVQVL